MRKMHKKQAEDFVKLLGQAHTEIKNALERKKFDLAMNLLEQCQEGAIELGHMIEELEGEGFAAIPFLENYCEVTYQIHENIWNHQQIHANKTYKKLEKALIPVENSIRNDIPVRLEAVFLPYKASMWDSLESVWMAADADPDCDAYVIPIPYYDRSQNGTLGACHYEGEEFPDYVPVTFYEDYSIEERKPDMIFIHNPYDQGNYVTTIDPRYYSSELKKHTPCLIYVPYYATAGGMSEGQALCQAYFYADAIIIQSEKFRRFFDPVIPKEKLLPLGSPKFDRVIRICSQPKTPPKEWEEKLEGKRAYFYNTSIHGMLWDTAGFLKKMEYVFRCFEGRKDVCLVWRPHPLLESTFDSMRKELRPIYDKLKQYFIESGLGIYDDTPDITDTIALCDGYIGDAGTSVTSLFGLAGKPMFILNNNIHSSPGPEDWKGQIIRGFSMDRQDDWMVTQGNKLYHAPNGDYRYEYVCDLSEYASGGYYSRAIEAEGRVYVCPVNAQELLVIGRDCGGEVKSSGMTGYFPERLDKGQGRIERGAIEQSEIEQGEIEQGGIEQSEIKQGRIRIDQGGREQGKIGQGRIEQYEIEDGRIRVEQGEIEQDRAEGSGKDLTKLDKPVCGKKHGRNSWKIINRISLEHCLGQQGAFAGAWRIGQYLFLVPNQYPAIVKYDTKENKVTYIKGYNEGFVQMVQGEWRIGGSCVWEHYLMLASPIDNHVIAIDSNTNQVQVMTTGARNSCGCMALIPNGSELWLLPFTGTVITCWNPKTGHVQEYSQIPEEFFCIHRPSGRKCMERPFYAAAFCEDKVFFSPYWGNAFLCLNRESGKLKEWKPPFPVPEKPKNGYYNSWAVGCFLYQTDTLGAGTYRFFSLADGKLYDVNLKTEEFQEIAVEFDLEELRRQEPGFSEESQWLQYCCMENCFNSLSSFLDGNVTGAAFDRDRQLRAFEKIAANHDGTSGEKIYGIAKEKAGMGQRIGKKTSLKNGQSKL